MFTFTLTPDLILLLYVVETKYEGKNQENENIFFKIVSEKQQQKQLKLKTVLKYSQSRVNGIRLQNTLASHHNCSRRGEMCGSRVK